MMRPRVDGSPRKDFAFFWLTHPDTAATPGPFSHAETLDSSFAC